MCKGKKRNLHSRLSEIDEITINLLLTRRCNYSCFHCMYASGPNMPKDELRWEDLNAIKGFIDAVSERLKPDTNFTVNLIGGEPTLNLDHFERTLDTAASWEREVPEGADWVNGISLEMTTNGWWLESYKDTVAFARTVWRYLSEERITVRISNSPYHDEFRAPKMDPLFKDRVEAPYYWNERQTTRLENYLEELGYEHLDTLREETEDDDADCYREDPDYWLLEELRKSCASYQLFIDSKIPGSHKISPVGRAKTNGIGEQDGECHPTNNVKFTFMPTKEGERPGRLYDPCCNGGKVPLGFADEGIDLLLRRILFIDALHKEIPLPEEGVNNPSPGRGERCAGCPAFGAKWIRENKAATEKVIAAAKKKILNEHRREELLAA